MTLEEILANLESKADENRARIFGVVTGTVLNPVDPLMLGRVQLRIPSIDSLDLNPWARIAQPMAGATHGSYFVPNIGDEVLVAFEHGDINVPYIIGSLWNMVARPPLPSPLAQIRATRTLVGNQIVMEELPLPALTIQCGPTPPIPIPAPTQAAMTIRLSSLGIEINALPSGRVTIQVGPNQIEVGSEGISLISAAGITLKSAGEITMQAPTITIAAAGDCAISAAMVRINS